MKANPSPASFARWCSVVLASLVAPAFSVTVEDFDVDTPTPAYEPRTTNSPPGPQRLVGGPSGSGKFLRLVTRAPQPPPASSNTITFPLTDPTPAQTIVAEFDFRILAGATRGDGFGFTLLNATAYPQVGVEPNLPPFAVEEPGYTGSIGVGFDIYANPRNGPIPEDRGHDGIRPNFSSSVSLHFNGRFLAQVDTVPFTDLAHGGWLRARVLVQGARVTVQLAPTPGDWITLLSRVVPGFRPYPARAHFGARSGGETADVDLDNVSVVFLGAGQSAVSFASHGTEMVEEVGAQVLTVTRLGDTRGAASVGYATTSGSALAGADFTGATGTLNFAPRQTSAALTIPILNDAATESAETFTVTLSAPTGGAVLGTTRTTVRLLDDETAAAQGRWSQPFGVGITGIHAALLPTGRVLLLDRIAQQSLWDPRTRIARRLPAPPGRRNLFCSGHSFLPDGSLLVAGGHDDVGHGHAGAVVGGGEHDGLGLATAFRFLPASNRWAPLPRMRGGRWYPTLTTLADGSVLALSGSVEKVGFTYVQNTLPEVWEPAARRWRPLTNAQHEQVNSPSPHPQGLDLYPRMFLGPDGRVVKVGSDRDSWYLDPAGAGDWEKGPARITGEATYAAAVMFEPGKILFVGGANPPRSAAEVLDLHAATPAWQAAGAMSEPRRQLNATTLPDGTVLVTGGSKIFADADGVANPVRTAELWNPATGLWTTMAAMEIARLYHSIALLLPDGRVFSAGGGHSGAATSFHNEAEIYSPPYLFKGPRPVITAAPAVLSYGQTFLVRTPDAAAIASACLIRLAAVTHSFDMNARRVPLSFTRTQTGLIAAAPAAGTVAPPGHYLLFILNSAGVPSVAPVVQLAVDPPGGIYRGLVQSTPASHEAAGLIQVAVNSQNSFSATIVFGGRSQVVRGAFDANGEFSATIPGAAPLVVELQLDDSTGNPLLTGSLTRGGVTGAFVAERNFFAHRASPPPSAGRYTFWLPRPAGAALPQGHGHGTLVVSATGRARLVGVLGDRTPVSFGSLLPRSRPWPLHLPLYRGKGSLAGELDFREVPGTSDVEGRLVWIHSGVFSTEVALLGSRYVAPRRGVRVLDFAPALQNAIFRIAGGNLAPAPGDKSVTLTADNRVLIATAERFSLTITLADGLFTGAFADPATGRPRAFKGAILQKARLGAGLFPGNAATGSVELRPVP